MIGGVFGHMTDQVTDHVTQLFSVYGYSALTHYSRLAHPVAAASFLSTHRAADNQDATYSAYPTMTTIDVRRDYDSHKDYNRMTMGNFVDAVWKLHQSGDSA